MMKKLDREQMAARVARDIPEGAYVNLGIGLPTLVADHLPKGREIILHSENGILGMGPAPAPGEEDEDLINAGKEPVTLLAGGAYFHHADSFAHDPRRPPRLLRARAPSRSRSRATSPTGTPARRTRFPRSAARWISRSARRRCCVMMEHLTKKGEARSSSAAHYPLTARCVDRIYTDLAVIDGEGRWPARGRDGGGLSFDELQRLHRCPAEEIRYSGVEARLTTAAWSRGVEDLVGLLELLLHELGELRNRQVARHGAQLGKLLAQIRRWRAPRSRPC